MEVRAWKLSNTISTAFMHVSKNMSQFRNAEIFKVVRVVPRERLELSRRKALEPKSSMSTNSITWALKARILRAF